MSAAARPWYWTCLSALAVACFCLVGSAADEALAPFTVATSEGLSLTGTLQELRDDSSFVLGGEKPTRLQGSEVISLRRTGKALPPFPTVPHLAFGNGDWLPGVPVELSGERLRVKAELGLSQEMVV